MSATETHWLAPAVYPALIAFVCAVVILLWRKFLEVGRSTGRCWPKFSGSSRLSKFIATGGKTAWINATRIIR